ncbi:hypothetical protein ACLKA6_012988 [Drosophila palustris]
MKFSNILVALVLLVTLARAQPVLEEDPELKDALDQDGVEEVHQDETLVAEPPELVDAIDELMRQEQESGKDLTSVDSHSRLKRAVCSCVRRGRRVVCICRR